MLDDPDEVMPSLVGKTIAQARAVIPGMTLAFRTSAGPVLATALSGAEKICSQKPAPGAAFDQSGATLTVARSGAAC